MRDGVYLINTARGELINEKAMLDSLENGKLGGIALDVLCNETEPTTIDKWSQLHKHYNVVLTPHIGGATYESLEKVELRLVNKVINYLAGLPN